MKTTSKTKKPARAKSKKTPAPIIRAATGNPCDDQNGMLLCWGGQQHNVPFPTSGGPYMPVIAHNSQTGLMELQYADLTTLCPGNGPHMVAVPCVPCGESQSLDAPTTEVVPETEQPNS